MDKENINQLANVGLVLIIVCFIMVSFVSVDKPEFTIYKEKCWNETEKDYYSIHDFINCSGIIREDSSVNNFMINCGMDKFGKKYSMRQYTCTLYPVIYSSERICKRVPIEKGGINIECDYKNISGGIHCSGFSKKEFQKEKCEKVKVGGEEILKKDLTEEWLNNNCQCYIGTNQDGKEIYKSCDYFPKKVGDELIIKGASRWKLNNYTIKKND